MDSLATLSLLLPPTVLGYYLIALLGRQGWLDRAILAFARALVLKPQILLLDEPLAALDGFLRAKMRGVLLEVQNHFRIRCVAQITPPGFLARISRHAEWVH